MDETDISRRCLRWLDEARRPRAAAAPARPLVLAAHARRLGATLPLLGRPLPVERAAPEEVGQALAQKTPQAILRDLHRPVKRFAVEGLEYLWLGIVRDARQPTEGIRASALESRRVAIDALVPTRGVLAEVSRDVAAALGSSWAEAPKTGIEPVTTESTVYYAPSLSEE